MDQAVRWSPLAREDLKEAAAYIAADSPFYADAFIDDVLEAASRLSAFPHMGHVVPEFDQADLREVPVRRHRLIYRVSSSEVMVVGLIHGARDLSPLWRNRGRSEQ